MKYILPVTLILLPYVGLAVIILLDFHNYQVTIAGIVILANVIFAVFLLKKGDNSYFLVRWNYIMKVWHLLYYVFSFVVGIFSIWLGLPFLIVNYILLLSTSSYGICGIISACKEDKLFTVDEGIRYSIFLVIFCCDIFAAESMYKTVRAFEGHEKYRRELGTLSKAFSDDETKEILNAENERG